MRIAVLVKQVPLIEEIALDRDGRLARSGVPMEMNPHCRRAVAKGVELAAATGGSCTVVTMGPMTARQVLVEALDFGCDDGVLISDPAFAGSDTLATARALAAALTLAGPFDLILTGRNSVDADTGQVGPQLAELTGLPFLAGVRELRLAGQVLTARTERDDGWRDSVVALPAVLSCAERLCAPAKRPDAVETPALRDRIRLVTAADLGAGPWGQAGSPTRVGTLRRLTSVRAGTVLAGGLDAQAGRIAEILESAAADTAPARPHPGMAGQAGAYPVAVLAQPGRPRITRELLGEAARLSPGRVTAVLSGTDLTPQTAECWGADEAVIVSGHPGHPGHPGRPSAEEDIASAVAGWCLDRGPRALLGPGTSWGREVAARIAARLGAGLVGDAVELALEEGQLICQKPVAGGSTLAAVYADSAVQLVTVRPGVLATPVSRVPAGIPVISLTAPADSRVTHVRQWTDSGIDELASARIVIGVGAGVDPDDYPLLRELAASVGAELAATRKVTDRGWQPHGRQVGVTGRSIAPEVYLALGLSGKDHHTIGVRRAATVVAVNRDPDAPVFRTADLGVVADWRPVVRALLDRLRAARRPPAAASAAR
ncbi:FAD-binding protein [Streptomyces sp. NPDC126933]|uniref:FAD-binding protein n=1 Tax=unclassified Streptomyces TaxID=2593676 RepID=UPI00365B8F63